MRWLKSSEGGQELLTAAAAIAPTSSGRPAWRTGLAFALTPKKQMIDDYCAHMDAVIASARKPYYAATPLPPVPTDPLNQTLLPVFTNTSQKWAERDAQWGILQTRLAARAYQSQHGVPPPSLATLVPGYLPATPRDPFAGKPLVYRIVGGKPLIYSRGPDGDDDGGRPLPRSHRPGTNGDLTGAPEAMRR